MKKRQKRHKGNSLKRLEINLDLLMSNKFSVILKKMLLWTGIAFGVLVVLGLLHSFLRPEGAASPGALLPGQLFLDLNNPSFSDTGEAWSFWWFSEHIIVILTNLVGIILINGILLSFVINWLSSRREKFVKGEARYRHFRKGNFSVIIGGHRMAAHLARELIAKKENEYVLIQTQLGAEELRREVRSQIDDIETAQDVIIYSGYRGSWHELEELSLSEANEIFILGENEAIDGDDHDALNMKCWRLINENLRKEGKVDRLIPCHVMFEYQSTFAAFQSTDISFDSSGTFRFIPFSLYESWAQQVISGETCGDKRRYTPLDGFGGISWHSPERVHLIIAGMSKMGMAIAVEAARTAHYPNFNNGSLGHPRTLITFIDPDACRQMRYFAGRYNTLFQLARWRYVEAPSGMTPAENGEFRKIYDDIKAINEGRGGLYPWHRPLEDAECGSPYCGGFLGEDLVDIDFEFIQGDVAMPSIRRYIKDACADEKSRTTLAVCIPVSAEAMAAALYLDSSVYENVQEIWIEQSETGALVDAISKGLTGLNKSRYSKLRAFGMADSCDYLRADSLLPRLVAYAYNCLDRGSSLYREYLEAGCTISDRADGHWSEIGHEGGKSAIAKRWSNHYCANSISTKIRSFGLDGTMLGEIGDAAVLERMAKVEHNRWVVEQLLAGYMPPSAEAVGRELSAEERTELKSRGIHPDLVSNDKLGRTSCYDVAISKIVTLVYALANKIQDHERE